MVSSFQKKLQESIVPGSGGANESPNVGDYKDYSDSEDQGKYKPFRGISAKTCQLYRYEHGVVDWPNPKPEHKGKPCHYARINGGKGGKPASKVRILNPKDFWWLNKGEKTQLFGQHIGGGNHLVITEGEVDAMSVHEAYLGRADAPVVVSTCFGKQYTDINYNLQYILSFEKVTVFPDCDDAGEEGSEKLMRELSKVVTHATCVQSLAKYKDANEALQDDQQELIRDAIAAATKYQPAEVINASELVEDTLNPSNDRGLDLCWNGWNKHTQGMKPGELWLIAGGTGIGKSLFTRSMALWLCNQKHKVAYIGLEEEATTTLERMISEQMGEQYHLWSKNKRQAERTRVREATKEFATNLLLMKGFDCDNFSTFVDNVSHYVRNEECKVVFLDHFSLLADGIALNVDQRRAIDKAIKELKALAMRLEFTFVVVCHLSRSQGFGATHEEGGEPKLSELRGSHSLAQIPDYIWMLSRNPLGEHPNVTSCWLKKNRIKGEVGMFSELKFDPNTCQFEEGFGST
jgi:twinkle protein